jgi:small GTP-binding protein
MASKKYIKVCLVGDGGVGKTSLLQRYIRDEFNENVPLTVFMNCETKIVRTQENKYTLFLYDFGGQQRFRFMLDDVNRIKPDVVLLTFDLTDMETFLSIEQYHELINNGQLHKSEVLLVGSKSDLKRNVPKEKIEAFCDSRKIYGYIEVSAKTGEMIEPLFHEVVECHINNGCQIQTHMSDWINLTAENKKFHQQTTLRSHWSV